MFRLMLLKNMNSFEVKMFIYHIDKNYAFGVIITKYKKMSMKRVQEHFDLTGIKSQLAQEGLFIFIHNISVFLSTKLEMKCMLFSIINHYWKK